MLIDTTHPEETRVVVLAGNRLEEFDFETSTKAQIKGNIYLAKVTRVEPSLQAAFVEYGGNRHGFLAFGEIHPDYYRIPVADREALIAEATAMRAREMGEDAFDDEPAAGQASGTVDEAASDDGDHSVGEDGDAAGEDAGDDGAEEASADEPGAEDATNDGTRPARPPRRGRPAGRHLPIRRARRYTIQEVIVRRQIMLVQVVKEERGTKGAALTTFLSLAGRYCVLMPNTPRGGGVSRKIGSAADRKRLKTMLDEFGVPDGMAVIVRTAGAERTKPEIKRDYEYLIRLWGDIRELTMKSQAPALIHAEGDLIKRAIRDLYARDIEEVLIEGDEGYRTAKDFMRMLVPSHAKRVKPYKDVIPLMHRYQVEGQLDAIHSPTVQLPSGGYIVINQTEALVAIDVNSGRSTRERNIEDTALKTNIEAADEVARQLRLRDLAGLIVVDFIDMEERRHVSQVEKRFKEATKNDRARIQIGHISAFGLLELSRQRLRPSVTEVSSERCPHCGGTGHVRSIESTALVVLRAIEEEGIKGKTAELLVHVPTAVALYVLNQKRPTLLAIEGRYGLAVQLVGDDALVPPNLRLERLRMRGPGDPPPAARAALAPPALEPEEVDEIDDEAIDEATEEAEGQRTAGHAERQRDGQVAVGDGGRRRRRRRRRRGGEDGTAIDHQGPQPQAARDANDETVEADRAEGPEGEAPADGFGAGPDGAFDRGEGGRRRRGRRGGRRRRRFEGSGRQEAAPAFASGDDRAAVGRYDAPDRAEEEEIDPLVDRPEPKRPATSPELRAIAEKIQRALAAEGEEASPYRSRFASPPPPSTEPVTPAAVAPASVAPVTPDVEPAVTEPITPEPTAVETPAAEAPKPRRGRRKAQPAAEATEPAEAVAPAKPKRMRRKAEASAEVPAVPDSAATVAIASQAIAPAEQPVPDATPEPTPERRPVAGVDVIDVDQLRATAPNAGRWRRGGA
jgi:ribonuclease E